MEKFIAIIESADNGMDAALIFIPFDVEQVFGAKKPKVKAVFDGKVEYRGTLTRMQTVKHLLLMRKDIRAALGKQVGDEVEVCLELDTAPRTVEIPTELTNLLEQNPDAFGFFNSLAYTCQKEYVGYINEAKKEETRIRRAEKTVEMLLAQKKTPR